MSRRKGLSDEEIEALLFADTDESELEEEDDGWKENSMTENDNSFAENDDNFDASISEENENDATNSEEETQVKWSEIIENAKIKLNEFNNFAGPMHNLPVGSTPLNYLKLFLTDEVLEIVRINTNKYAEFCAENRGSADKEWYPIENVKEIWAYFTILLIMSVNQVPRISDYWSNSPFLGNEMVKKIMSRNRFTKIKHYFHLSDREQEKRREDDEFTYTQKVEPFMTYIKANFLKHFEPYQRLSIDEALVKYKGRLGIVQYMPLKPDKRGIKMWMLCTSQLGYTLNFDVYSGKNTKMKRSGKGLGYDVVFHLIECLKKPGHDLYFDRFFTSVDLMIDLNKKGLGACGTGMPNIKMPAEIKRN